VIGFYIRYGMTLEQLRIFVGVAEREHMTAAARALNVTQSAASAAIAALEERHAIKLFHRVGRGIALTEAGRLFLTEARGVLARADAAETVLEELGGLKRGTLRRPSLRLSMSAIRRLVSNCRSATPGRPRYTSMTARPIWVLSRARSTTRRWRIGRSAKTGCCSSEHSLSATPTST
jgi:DNA-binding MarR family transcriptional regulator